MEKTDNLGQETTTVEETVERTFTQAELDEILKARLGKERAKYSDYEILQQKASKLDELEEASKTELQKVSERAEALQKELDAMKNAETVRGIRDAVANETGVPASLLTADTEEGCKSQAEAILAFKSQNTTVSYPSVRDGGEVQNATVKKSASDQFADWFNANLNN